MTSQVLQQIHFSMLLPYSVAGMGEPWIEKMAATHADLRRNGIGAILTLTEDNLYGQHHIEAGFLLHHEPMDDGEAPAIVALERSMEFIDSAQCSGHGVAVHCLEGRGRTGAVLACWLARKENLRAESAIKRLRYLRPYTALSASQKKFLLDYLD